MTGVLGGASGDPPEGAEALLVPPSALTGVSEGDPPWGGADGASDAPVSASALDDTRGPFPHKPGASWVSSSASGPTPTRPPSDALPLVLTCPVCLVESEDGACDICGRNLLADLNIDRLVPPSVTGPGHEPEGA